MNMSDQMDSANIVCRGLAYHLPVKTCEMGGMVINHNKRYKVAENIVKDFNKIISYNFLENCNYLNVELMTSKRFPDKELRKDWVEFYLNFASKKHKMSQQAFINASKLQVGRNKGNYFQ